MQLTFPFDKDYPAIDRTKEFFEALFQNIKDQPLRGDWFRDCFKYGGVFLHTFKPQLEFPHSEYWGFEDCEP